MSNESEEKKQANASKNVSLFFGVRSIGVLLTAYSGGLLLEFISKQTSFQSIIFISNLVFIITAMIPLTLSLISLTLKERPKLPNENSRTDNISLVFKFLKQPQIMRPLIFIFLFMATPSTGSSMFYFYTNVLGFHPEFLGELRLLSSFATLSGIFIYNRWLS